MPLRCNKLFDRSNFGVWFIYKALIRLFKLLPFHSKIDLALGTWILACPFYVQNNQTIYFAIAKQFTLTYLKSPWSISFSLYLLLSFYCYFCNCEVAKVELRQRFSCLVPVRNSWQHMLSWQILPIQRDNIGTKVFSQLEIRHFVFCSLSHFTQCYVKPFTIFIVSQSILTKLSPVKQHNRSIPDQRCCCWLVVTTKI